MIHCAGRVYGFEEKFNLFRSSVEFWLTEGHWSKTFEYEFSEYLGVGHSIFVNSGSSANLLAFMALTQPEHGDRRINRGDEVITTACGFPTTIAPIIQYGAVPVFVDITIPEYNVDVSQLELAVSKKTKAVILAHTLGLPFNLGEVSRFCKKYNLWLIEDNCDALGAGYYGRKTGSFGDISTHSFYPAHHITTGEGGMVCTKDGRLATIIRSLRDWGRDCKCATGQDNKCHQRFERQDGKLPRGYDHKYVYSRFGYNLKATEMQAAIGCAQIKRLPGFIRKRIENWRGLSALLKNSSFCLTNYFPGMSPFGFAITRDTGKRESLVKQLEAAGIQTRSLFGGNLTKQPCFEHLVEGKDYMVIGDLPETNRAMLSTFWVGVYPKITAENIRFMANTILGR